MKKNVGLLGVPTHWGVGIPDLTKGPTLFREQRIVPKLQEAGFNVIDEGDIDCAVGKSAEIKNSHLKYLDEVVAVSERTAEKVTALMKNGRPLLVIGGDHSLDIGAVAGASAAIGSTLGLLYIDEHGDMHMSESTETGNIHGMVLASLMGFGDERLIRIGGNELIVSKENVVHIGGAEFDRYEHEFVAQEDIETYQLSDIMRHGWERVFKAIDSLEKRTDKIWVSIDLDSINDDVAPGVTMPDKNGLLYREITFLTRYIGQVCDVAGVSIAEYNHTTDVGYKTVDLSIELAAAVLGGRYDWYSRWVRKHYAAMTGGQHLIDI